MEERGGSRREDCELRMLIHQSQAGCVIGKAGGKLRDMRQDFGVEIKVFASCCPMSTDRIVRVTGVPQKVVKCLISIVEMLRTVSISQYVCLCRVLITAPVAMWRSKY